MVTRLKNPVTILGPYTQSRSIQPYHFQADQIWCDGTFNLNMSPWNIRDRDVRQNPPDSRKCPSYPLPKALLLLKNMQKYFLKKALPTQNNSSSLNS
jgi:hypothetical protein